MLSKQSFRSAKDLYVKLLDVVADHMLEGEPKDPQIAVLGSAVTMFVLTMKLTKEDPHRFGREWQLVMQTMAADLAVDEVAALTGVMAEFTSQDVLDKIAEIANKVNAEPHK